MTCKHNDQLAQGILNIAIQRLVEKYPFHVSILERFELRCRPDIATVGVTVSGDDVLLLFNPQFVTSITLDELGGVLLHEVHHILFGHVLVDPADYPDDWARTVAEEVTVNEFVNEPLPGTPIRLDQFKNLPPMESTAKRYSRLNRKSKRPPISMEPIGEMGGEAVGGDGGRDDEGDNSTGGSGKGDACKDDSGKGDSGEDSNGKDDADNNADGTAKRPSKANSGSPNPKNESSAVTDDHSVWKEARENPKRSEDAIRAVVHDAVTEVGRDQVPDALSEILDSLGIGKSAGHVEENLSRDRRGSLDWVHLLRRFVGRHLVSRPNFGYPPRRFPHMVGIIPGKRRRGGRPHIMAVIDTSGSMTAELLDRINSELSRLASDHHVTVVECDAEIQQVYPYRKITSVSGRGGTDFRPPFERPFLQKHRPDVVIYFTDGFGPAPVDRPRVPVLWVLTPDGEKPAEWGEEARMLDDEGPK